MLTEAHTTYERVSMRFKKPRTLRSMCINLRKPKESERDKRERLFFFARLSGKTDAHE
jgi:hypothetical protein